MKRVENKTFDAVESVHEWRRQNFEETKDMTTEQRIAHLRRRSATLLEELFGWKNGQPPPEPPM
jgi:hypothetical protein